ncbi:hypothetical protein BXY70_1334 [Roseovarius halotolerans]|uniref:Uncharacterized protein n=1 Tax=Roseovarius halotolerans TaxID=505353 RepID=A0A1X6Y5M9_9RHOB|nr:hypothetical protein [Roseovarius halotolerans]RKT35301.1 hypothetical protein BXY70_1334 [Roseovarius halotolerans]SLN11092.1 hypothetical protein ROH8110_00062 [Roseovarius halotolerans]
MKDMVKLKRADLEQVLRDALRLGAQGHGVKHKRLVQGLMEEADGKAIPMNEMERERGEIFESAVERRICSRIGLPHWIVTGDVSGISDRVARHSIKLARKNVNSIFDRAERQLKPIGERAEEEVSCGDDDCCPSLPADIIAMTEASRRSHLLDKITGLPGFCDYEEEGLDRLHSLTTAQLEQVIRLAKP